jgi:hypothetical protein
LCMFRYSGSHVVLFLSMVFDCCLNTSLNKNLIPY